MTVTERDETAHPKVLETRWIPKPEGRILRPVKGILP